MVVGETHHFRNPPYDHMLVSMATCLTLNTRIGFPSNVKPESVRLLDLSGVEICVSSWLVVFTCLDICRSQGENTYDEVRTMR